MIPYYTEEHWWDVHFMLLGLEPKCSQITEVYNIDAEQRSYVDW